MKSQGPVSAISKAEIRPPRLPHARSSSRRSRSRPWLLLSSVRLVRSAAADAFVGSTARPFLGPSPSPRVSSTVWSESSASPPLPRRDRIAYLLDDVADEAPPPRSSWRYAPPRKSRYDIKKTKSMILVAIDPASGSTVTLRKKPNESLEHVLVKGILWSVFGLAEHGGGRAFVERDVGDRRVPDVVVLPADGGGGVEDAAPLFWGESGRMSPDKAAELLERYPHTHIVHMRWGMGEAGTRWIEEIEERIGPTLARRTAPFEIGLVREDPRNFFDEEGNVRARREDFDWVTFE